jgi:ribose transport system permease protein
LWYTGGVTITSAISPNLRQLGTGDWLGLPKPFWFFAVVAVLGWYVLEHTPVGRYLYSVGASPRAAERVGLRVRRFGFVTFLCAGTLAGVAGVLLVAIQGGGNPQLGQNFVLPALAAAFLGATAIKPGRYNIPGAIVAIFLLAISVNGLTLIGAEPWVNEMFNGVALLVGVGVSVVSGKRRQRGTSGDAGTPAKSQDEPIESSVENPVHQAEGFVE